MEEVELLKSTYQHEIHSLKKKLVESEKKMLQMWEHIKDNNIKNDHRLSVFEQMFSNKIKKDFSQGNH
jgi:hypothetical protein